MGLPLQKKQRVGARFYTLVMETVNVIRQPLDRLKIFNSCLFRNDLQNRSNVLPSVHAVSTFSQP